jgi:predicted helicase
MSQLLINEYLKQLDILKKVSGSSRETIIREAFKDLLKAWGRQQNLVFLAEFPYETITKSNVELDGALLHAIRTPHGFWEAKDLNDNLDKEIEKKFRKGYPQNNIIFSNDKTVVLIQNKEEVLRTDVEDTAKLAQLLKLFFEHLPKAVVNFRVAVEQFKTDLPAVLESLREMIDTEHAKNKKFRAAEAKFLAHAQEAINPSLTDADVREMLIQHILTEEIFATVFKDGDFHRANNVAKELYALESEFFTGSLKKQTLKGLEPYYAAINSAAANISSHGEKQAFLKVIYENFYKVYNIKAADRLGVVYTPNEIVRFMIEGADWLCETHFGKNLIDKDVEILDPATGTGTFICELLEHFRGQPKKLEHKYKHELHANEVAILPYYVANLNIEATYAAITGLYEEFPSLCFVDTLDNVGLHTAQVGTQADLLGSVSEENVKRIKRQNDKRISVVIGNPPYNANQLNANDANKNRDYPLIDKRIKLTYGKNSTAQAKNKGFDMYARFFRWASDRLHENGVIAFVSNNSFIDSRTFDGFRKSLASEFNEVWVIDLKGNARTSGDRRRQEGGNIFDDQIRVGIAIWFCVRRKGASGCKVMYEAVQDFAKADEKRDFLTTRSLRDRRLDLIRPDEKSNWIGLTSNDFNSLIPIASKDTKNAKTTNRERAIFRTFSLGVTTNRDEWLYDKSHDHLEKKVRWFLDVYKREVQRVGGNMLLPDKLDRSIKWTRALLRSLEKRVEFDFDKLNSRICQYRPFVGKFVYFAPGLNEYMYDLPAIYPSSETTNRCINVSVAKEFRALASDGLCDLHFVGDTMLLPYDRFDVHGNQANNITDWGLKQFQAHYEPAVTPAKAGAQTDADVNDSQGLDSRCRGKDSKSKKSKSTITKEAIFHYCYAVLHDPIYREKYALNLKREFPRIPFYGETVADFERWAAWGKALMDLHIGYEAVAPFGLSRTDVPDARARAAGLAPKAILRADASAGKITIDSETTLNGIPAAAWDYKLGNRCALEWILDQYKEKKPKDPTIREKFDTYRFADYKEKVIDLLMRVTTLSVETMRMVNAMKDLKR